MFLLSWSLIYSGGLFQMGTQKRKVKADKLERTIQGEISAGYRRPEWGKIKKPFDKGKFKKGGNIQWPK
jgi:hypothetical protein